MPILAANKLALMVVVTPADFLAWPRDRLLWSLHCWRPGGHVREPAQERAVGVPRTGSRTMVVLQAVQTSGDGPSPAREGLIVQPGVCYRPIQVLTGQYLPPELAVVDDPPGTFIVPLFPHYSGLIDDSPDRRRARLPFQGSGSIGQPPSGSTSPPNGRCS